MIVSSPRAAAAVVVIASLGACATARPSVTTPASSTPPTATATPAQASEPRASAADIHFMTGMIPHHAQAVIMAKWAPTHGARKDVQILAERIVVAQQDEINLVRGWLMDVGAPVPAADAKHVTMTMNGMVHDMVMPGMLTDAEMAQLDRARGSEFDRLFLNFMIRHHEGAITMVDQLFASYAAAQDETVFRFASDVYADQTSEIARMQQMLETVPPGAP